jgi:plastocyanin
MARLLRPLLAIALASAGLALAACGGGSGDATTSSDPDAIQFEATDGIAYTETEVEAKAGDDTIALSNPSSIPHDVVIEDGDGNTIAQTDTVSGESTETTAELEPGTYTFYCSVDAHRDQGMEGTLTVK